MEGNGTLEIDGVILLPEKAIIIDDTAIISDLHLGIEQSMPGSVPRLQIREIVEMAEKIFDYGIETLIVNGDMKHEFSQNMPYEWDDVRYFVERMLEIGKLRVVRGNHDNYLATILAKYGIELERRIELADWTIVHGHEEVEGKKLVIGHEHPSIRLRSGYSSYTYPCFLRCSNEREVLVLPAFSPMLKGSDVLSTFEFLSPILNSFSSAAIEVYAIEDGIYEMGDLKKLREIIEMR
ncbi:MAG: metallophosphoesterase [Archaeoglobus sp.]|nr:metallophosphoesterase [Archaeoglobus sp.]